MAGVSAFDNRIRRRQPKPWPWFVAGLLLGVIIGWAASEFLKPSTSKEPKATGAGRPAPVPLMALRIMARPPRGMTLSSNGTLKLVSAGASKLSEQKDKTILVGFRNWNGTVRYLTAGDGTLFLRDRENVVVSGGWKPDDYRSFVKGKPLQIKIKRDLDYTLYFQRTGSTPIPLCSFSAGVE